MKKFPTFEEILKESGFDIDYECIVRKTYDIIKEKICEKKREGVGLSFTHYVDDWWEDEEGNRL